MSSYCSRGAGSIETSCHDAFRGITTTPAIVTNVHLAWLELSGERAPARRCQTPECRLLCSAQLASVHSETPCPPSPSEARVSKRPPCTSAREAFPARRGREGSVGWCGTVRVSQFPEKYQIEGRTKETGQRSALTSTKREVVRRTFTVVAEVLFARHRHVVRIGEIFHRRPLPRLRDPMGVRGGNDALQGASWLRAFSLAKSWP